MPFCTKILQDPVLLPEVLILILKSSTLRSFMVALLGRIGWLGFIDLPSRVFARCLHGIGWPTRICPIAVSGRGKCRKFDRPVVCRVNYCWTWTTQYSLVFTRGNCRNRGSVQSRTLVSNSSSEDHRRKSARGSKCFVELKESRVFSVHPDRLDFFKIFLSDQPHELLHILSNPNVPCLGGQRAGPSVLVSVCRRGGNIDRRTAR